jgi:hypothetical protein
MLSALKFLVEPFSSLKVNFRRFEDSMIPISVLQVGGTNDEEPDVLVPRVPVLVVFLLLLVPVLVVFLQLLVESNPGLKFSD